MSEWQVLQQKPNTKLRDLLKSKKAKTRKLSELSKTEQNRLAKLNGMLDELRRGENVQNRRLITWLTEDEYESFESDWQSQLQIREELKDKPDELSDTKINYIKPLLTTIKLSVFTREVIKINPLNFVI